MNNFNHQQNNSRIIQNGLIVIMALFDDSLNDSFFTNSTNLKDLDDDDRKSVIHLIEEEIFI
jgi:hypothetical protein